METTLSPSSMSKKKSTSSLATTTDDSIEQDTTTSTVISKGTKKASSTSSENTDTSSTTTTDDITTVTKRKVKSKAAELDNGDIESTTSTSVKSTKKRIISADDDALTVGRNRASTNADLQPSLKTLAAELNELPVKKARSKDDTEMSTKTKPKKSDASLIGNESSASEVNTTSKKTKRKSVKSSTGFEAKTRDQILNDSGVFAKSFEAGATQLKLNKEVLSNASIMQEVSVREDAFGQRMTSQTDQFSSEIVKLGGLFEEQRKQSEKLLAEMVEKANSIVHDNNMIEDDESADQLARKIQEKWDAESKKAADFNKSWAGFVSKHWKYVAGGGVVVGIVLIYFFWVWLWWLIKMPFRLVNLI